MYLNIFIPFKKNLIFKVKLNRVKFKNKFFLKKKKKIKTNIIINFFNNFLINFFNFLLKKKLFFFLKKVNKISKISRISKKFKNKKIIKIMS